MIDIKALVEQFDKGIDPELGTFPSVQFPQDTEKIDVSQVSQFPNEKPEIYKRHTHVFEKNSDAKNTENIGDVNSARDEHAYDVGNVGTAGNAKENNTLSFPIIKDRLGNWEIDGDPASAGAFSAHNPRFDFNRAGPQRADWWSSPLMAEFDRERALSGPVEPLPLIPPDKVRAGVERELRALAERGRTGPDAQRDAVAITRAKIRNSPLLAELQTKTDRCLICDGAEDGERPFIAVLSGHRDRPHWLHRGECHDEFIRRKAAKVDAIMQAAGFGPEAERGAA